MHRAYIGSPVVTGPPRQSFRSAETDFISSSHVVANTSVGPAITPITLIGGYSYASLLVTGLCEDLLEEMRKESRSTR